MNKPRPVIRVIGRVPDIGDFFAMLLKHWLGYGHVRAKRIRKHTNHDGTKYIEILVTGKHKHGVARNHVYDVYYWLLRRFTDDCAGFWDIRKLHVIALDPKTAVYETTYEPTHD